MYPFLTRYRQNFGKINQEGSVKRCQDKVLRKLTTAAATTRLRLCRKKKHLINLERLPFVWKTQKFRGEFKWNGSSRWKFSGKKVMPFEVFPFNPFLLKRPKFVVPFVWITSARLHAQRKRKLCRYFVNGTTQSRSCFRWQKKYRYHLTEIFDRNFRTNGKCSRGRGGGGGGVLGLIFAGYVPLASQSPYPITVYSVPNDWLHLSHF